jgi:hypothetical protein
MVSTLEPIKCDILVSKVAFKWVNLYRYAEDGRGGESKAAAAERGREVGLYKLTHSLKAPWFQPLIL